MLHNEQEGLTLPPKVLTTIKQYKVEHNLSDTEISRLVDGWYPQPTKHPLTNRLSRESLLRNQIDAYKLVQPLLGERRLNRTLRTMDTVTGCGNQCDTCLADAVLPSALFSFNSLHQLFSDKHFLLMLQPDSIRLGSSGDISDHPQGVEIIRMILEQTDILDFRRKRKECNNHTVKIYTNFRPKNEQQIIELVELAKKTNGRLDLTISLPHNKNDAVNKRFKQFAKEQSNLLNTEPYRSTFLHMHMYIFTYLHPELTEENVPEKLKK